MKFDSNSDLELIYKVFRNCSKILVDEKKNPLKIGLAYDKRQIQNDKENWIGVVLRNLPLNSNPGSVV